MRVKQHSNHSEKIKNGGLEESSRIGEAGSALQTLARSIRREETWACFSFLCKLRGRKSGHEQTSLSWMCSCDLKPLREENGESLSMNAAS